MITGKLAPEQLYWTPPLAPDLQTALSVGAYLVRSAGTVEQTFGGMNSNLWDNPFEWTLPEVLVTSRDVLSYLEEVESTRQRAFHSIVDDSDLYKVAPGRSGRMTPLFALMLETLSRASHWQGCAFATFRLFSTEDVPFYCKK